MPPIIINSEELHRIFEKLDKNRDGMVCVQELKWVLSRIGINVTMEELESFLEKSSLDFNEFSFVYQSIISSSIPETIKSEEEEEDDDDAIYMAFKVFDMNDDGFICCEELENVLSRLELWDETRRSTDDCKSMIRAYDTNFDGKLDFDEFKNMMSV